MTAANGVRGNRLRGAAAIAGMRNREVVVLISDRGDQEGQRGDLVVAGELATTSAVNLMAIAGRGLISAAMTAERLAALEIPPIEASRIGSGHLALHVGVDLRGETTTGISAADRAVTIRRLGADDARPEDFDRPGHIFPLAARTLDGDQQPGRVEAAVEMARLADLAPIAGICEVLNSCGDLADRRELLDLAAERGLLVASVADVYAAWRFSRLPEVEADLSDEPDVAALGSGAW